MKKLMFGFILIITGNTYAVEMNATVFERNSKNELVQTEVILEDLIDSEYLEGTYFKIVDKSSNDVIPLDGSSDDKVLSRARNVYYHLTKAKNFFKNVGFEQSEQIIIRIGVKDIYSKVAHFKRVQDKNDKSVYNNAHTILGGEARSRYGVEAWGKEIWFRDPKVIEFTDEEIKATKKALKSQIPDTNKFDIQMVLNNIIYAAISGNPETYLKNSGQTLAINYGTNWAMKNFIPEISMAMIDKSWFIDMAMIPEVSYHEYTHYVMSDYLPPVTQKPIMEGISDFMATRISGHEKIASQLDDFGNNVLERNARNEIFYEARFDLDNTVMLGQGTAFVLSTLTLVNDYIDQKLGKGSFAKILYKSRKHLNINSTVAKGLADAILKEVPFAYRLGVITIFNNVGL